MVVADFFLIQQKKENKTQYKLSQLYADLSNGLRYRCRWQAWLDQTYSMQAAFQGDFRATTVSSATYVGHRRSDPWKSGTSG